jgi:glycosyltransferase involved in cell wall biosynthesis
VTPVYNGAEFIVETVESVLGQRYPCLQYLVLDDGSRDDTLARLDPYREQITLLAHANMGESRTVNRGLELCEGELICVVNADDPLRPGAIVRAVEAYRSDPEALVFYPDWAEIDARSQVVREVHLPEFDLARMLEKFNVGIGPGVFIARRALSVVGLRDTSLRYTGDLDYWFRVALRGRMVHLGEVLATHRVHPQAASSAQQGSTMAEEVVRLATKYSADPLFPDELKARVRLIRAKANFAASFYCGGGWLLRSAYLGKAFALAPLYFIGLVLKHVRYLVAEALPEPVRRTIRQSLGRDKGEKT